MRKTIAIVILTGLLTLLVGCPVLAVYGWTDPSYGETDTSAEDLAEGEVRAAWTPANITKGRDFEGKPFSETIFLRPPAEATSFTLTINYDDDEAYSESFYELSDRCSITFNSEDADGLTAPLHKATAEVEYFDQDGDPLDIAPSPCQCWWSEEDDLTFDVEIDGLSIAPEDEDEDIDEDWDEDWDDSDDENWLFTLIPAGLVLFGLISRIKGKDKAKDDEDEGNPEDDEWTPDLSEDDLKAEAVVQAVRDKVNEAKEKLTGARTETKPETRPADKPKTKQAARMPANPETRPADKPSSAPTLMDLPPNYTENPFESGLSRKRHKDNPFEK